MLEAIVNYKVDEKGIHKKCRIYHKQKWEAKTTENHSGLGAFGALENKHQTVDKVG